MQGIHTIRFVIAGALTTCLTVGTAAAQAPQPQPPSQQQAPEEQQPPEAQQPPEEQQPPQAQPQPEETPLPPQDESQRQGEQPSQQPLSDQDQANQQTGRAPQEVMAERLSATATVEKVDTKKRQLTLKDPQGHTTKIDVPKDVTNLDAIKKGDTVKVDYYSSLALALEKGEKGEKAEKSMQPGMSEKIMGERTPAKLPGGVVAKQIQATVEVVDVDTSKNTLTVKGPGGEEDTIKVSDPHMQKQLANIKPGDRIQAKYQEAVAIRVTPPAQKDEG